MSDMNQLNVSWYQTERQAQKTMQQLSGLHELEFYLSHPDEYIRHQAILRLGQLRLKDALAPLSKIIDDPLETPMNRELAAWVLKSSGMNHEYYIGNQFLDKFTGDEKLKDFYYPYFRENRTKPEYHFGSSGIEGMLVGETLMIKAESLEDKVDLPFSVEQWIAKWFQMKIASLRNIMTTTGKKTTKSFSGLVQQITHPESKQAAKHEKAAIETAHTEGAISREQFGNGVLNVHENASAGSAAFDIPREIHEKTEAIKVDSGIGINPEKTGRTEPALVEASAEPVLGYTTQANIKKTDSMGDWKAEPASTMIPAEPEHETVLQTDIRIMNIKTEPAYVKAAAEPGNGATTQADTNIMGDKAIRATETAVVKPAVEVEHKSAVQAVSTTQASITSDIRPGDYIKPFTLKRGPDEEIGKKRPRRSMIYVRRRPRDVSFGEAIKSFSGKLMRILLLPFVILWNQKVVFLVLITSLYLFFSFVPFGRMLFYRRAPELARINDNAVKSVQLWVTEKVDELQKKASEYELVRDIQKRMVTEEPEQTPEINPERYIVTSKTLNLRKAPGVKAEKLLLLEQNTIVEFLNESIKIDNGETWLYIKAPDGTMGWSYAGYLKKLEDGFEAYEGK